MNRLTPYNLIFVQKAEVDAGGEQKTVFIPRRCMHCDNPACATLCPFAANHKFENGAVVIDPETCFGGAKCQTLCPWQIPQRQSGIGVYLKVMPTLMGNGIMVKCDLCSDLLKEGKPPACIGACPQKAMSIGPRKEIYAQGRGPGGEDRRPSVRQGGERRNGHPVRFSRPVRTARSRHPQGARGAGTRKGRTADGRDRRDGEGCSRRSGPRHRRGSGRRLRRPVEKKRPSEEGEITMSDTSMKKKTVSSAMARWNWPNTGRLPSRVWSSFYRACSSFRWPPGTRSRRFPASDGPATSSPRCPSTMSRR